MKAVEAEIAILVVISLLIFESIYFEASVIILPFD